MSRWKKWPAISVILVLLLIGAAMWEFGGKHDSPSNDTQSTEGQFKPPKLNSGLPYPPADLVIVREIRADLTADGDLERAILGYHRRDNDGTEAYLSIHKRITGGKEAAYVEVYRDYLGSDPKDVHLESPPGNYYWRLWERFTETEDIRVSGGDSMVVASGVGWEGGLHGLNVEMVVWDVGKRQFKRIFAVGARPPFPLIKHVHLFDVDLDYKAEVVVFSTTGPWIDPETKHVFRVYKWDSKQKRYMLVSPDQPVETQGASGWIRKQ